LKDYSNLQTLQSDLNNGKTSCTELVEHYLQKIDDNQDLNAFVEVYSHDARSRATVIDAKIEHGTAGKLAGMVIGIKDNIAYQDHGLSASSKILEGFTSLYSATCVERLLEEDAIIIGRLNCDEFAMGSSNRFSNYGPVKNPLDKKLVPGGSSGGSAAAVAAGLCMASLGSDTGGSIRQPASFTGIYGFKPSYGRISRHGLIAFASSFDQIGPFANSVEDTALLYEIMAGPDQYDNTCSQREVGPVSLDRENKARKIAYFKDTLENDSLDPEVRKKAQEFIEKLRAAGHTVEGIDFPLLDFLVPTYYILSTAEASSNLARYDGIHFGYRSPNAHDLESTYKLSRTEGFGPEVKRRILLGTFVLSSGYYEAYYGKAQKTRRLVSDKTDEIFQDYDFIFSPTTPHTAFPIDQVETDPTQMYLEDIFTVHANITGCPSISLPLSQHKNGLPLGMQFTSAKYEEADLLQFAQTVVNN
jgi:aspartyl-tRNA(Asn)/glutamyl-tRNA(Gln) amidotransferase subunit A